MKMTKKILSLVLVLAVVLAFGATAFAQTVHGTTDVNNKGVITINNAAKGATYSVIKLFDATVSSNGSSIAYTGTVPPALNSFFEVDTAGNIKATAAATNTTNGEMSDALKTALKSYASTATALASGVCTDSPMVFDQLPYGYYIVTTTQGSALITVNSTKPNADFNDKNSTPPINRPTKTVDKDDVYVGDTVTYTVNFGTANFTSPPDNKLIVKYIIKDNFANGALENVTVTSLKIGGADQPVQQFDATGKIELPWVNANNQSLYANGAEIELTYTAKVAASATIDGQGNINTVTISYEDEGGSPPPPTPVTTEKTIYTYAFAIKKVNAKGENLAGAKFRLPFYVSAPGPDGAYVYAGTTAAANLVNEVVTPADGLVIVKGVKSGTYSIEEIEAPAGYNKLTQPVSAEAVKTGSTTTSVTKWIDANGNVVDTQTTNSSQVIVSIANLAATPVFVVNQSGTELPATGGVGTTIFYVLGSCLLIGAAVLMITRRRMKSEG